MKRVKNAGCRCFSIPVSIGLIRLMLLIRCPENAVVVKQTLEGNDIWATTLPILEPEIQQKAAELCPWETLTASLKRYMAIKSPVLKKIISAL